MAMKKRLLDVEKAIKGKKFKDEDSTLELETELREILDHLGENPKELEPLLDDIFRVLFELAKAPDNEYSRQLMEAYGDFCLWEYRELMKNKPKILTKYGPMLVSTIKSVPDPSLLAVIIRTISVDLLAYSSGKLAEHFKIWVEIIAAVAAIPDERYLTVAKEIMEMKEEILKWKEYPDGMQLILSSIVKLKLPPKNKDEDNDEYFDKKGRPLDDERKPDEVSSALKDFMEIYLGQIKMYKSHEAISKGLPPFIKTCVDTKIPDMLEIASLCSDFIGMKMDQKSGKCQGTKKRLLAAEKAIKGKKFKDEDSTSELETELRQILEHVVENPKELEPILDDAFRVLFELAKCPDNEYSRQLIDAYDDFCRWENRNLMKGNPKILAKYGPILASAIRSLPEHSPLAVIIQRLCEELLEYTSGLLPEHFKVWTEVIAALVGVPDARYIEAAKHIMENKKKILKWKDYPDGVQMILISISKLKLPSKNEDENDDEYFDKAGRPLEDERTPYEVSSALKDFVEIYFAQLKMYKCLGTIQKGLIPFITACVESKNTHMLDIAGECADIIDIKDDLQLAIPLIQSLERMFKDESFPWMSWDAFGLASTVLSKVMECHKDGEEFKPYNDYYISIFKSAMDKEHWNYEVDSVNIFGLILMSHLSAFVRLHGESKTYDQLQPILGGLIKNLTSEYDDVRSAISTNFMIISMADPKVFAPHQQIILDSWLKSKDYQLLSVITASHPLNPEPVKNNFDKIFTALEKADKNSRSNMLGLLVKAAETHPKAFTPAHIQKLMNGRYLDDQYSQSYCLQIMDVLSRTCPEKLEKHIDKLFTYIDKGSGMAYVPTMMVTIATKNKALTQRIFQKFIDGISANKSNYMAIAAALNSVRTLGIDNRELLEKHKALFEEIAQLSPQSKDMCSYLIDIIEGRSAGDIVDKIERQQDELENIDDRVTTTEGEVAAVTVTVDKQGKEITKTKEQVTQQGERIDKVEEVVEETVEKVEEIDNKTLSNAPAWSREVSKLLNPEAEHDWRLLAQRLGYTPDDIRGWATQHDPCMSLLSEWFATHKTSEATRGVLKTLEEMNRLDASEIVGRAMQAVENLVQDEPPDYESPPPIFISYQWGHQPEVRLLRKHLEMAGFESWMDIGQMGGGDKLYAKIDEGIRAAKAVICCVTDKYAKSPNCNREVNLAVNLGKPLLPILLEDVSWPPVGAMGPIFGEYLYIRFFQGSPAEETKDERVWPPSSFQELLMQLSYSKIHPVEEKVAKVYKNWWLPPDEVIVVKKKKSGSSKKPGATSTGEVKEDEKSPAIFISYQWGMQPQVKLLYRKLCGMGYDCWMDIYQMGGGDSLYDKIDRGVRGSKIVLSCITEKYAKSANCRREVSLADALKKPIIPLLLEETTWPPSGPMSMVFTQLLYINLSDPKVLKSWTGASFDEMIQKMTGYLQGNSGDKTSISETGKPDQKPNSGQISEPQKKEPPAPSASRNKPQTTPAPTANQTNTQTDSSSARQTVASKPPTSENKSKSCTML